MDYDRLERQVDGLVKMASARAQRLTNAISQMAKKHQPMLYAAMQSMTAEAKRLHDEGQDAGQARAAVQKLKEMYDFVTNIVSQGDQTRMPQSTLSDFFQRFPIQIAPYNQANWNELRRWFDYNQGIAPQVIRMLDYFDSIPKQ
jgi:hypothetical protein